MSMRRIVVIGASARGLDALRVLVPALPSGFPAPICVVVHTSPASPGVLGSILARLGTLPAANAQDGEHLRPGRVYVAPPDFYLTVEPGRVRVTRGPRENGFRPAIDPLLRSAAQVARRRPCTIPVSRAAGPSQPRSAPPGRSAALPGQSA